MFTKAQRIYRYVKNLASWPGEKPQIDKHGNEITNPKCVLGTNESVYKMSDAWDSCNEEIHMAMIHILNEFTIKKKFNSEEAQYFREGLAELPKFFRSCKKQRQIDHLKYQETKKDVH